MPTYEYKCTKCGDRFEIVQKITAQPLSTCSKCSGDLRKVLSPAGFVLKGSGWHVTDYPSDSRKKAMESEKPKTDKPKSEGTPVEKPQSKEPAKINQ